MRGGCSVSRGRRREQPAQGRPVAASLYSLRQTLKYIVHEFRHVISHIRTSDFIVVAFFVVASGYHLPLIYISPKENSSSQAIPHPFSYSLRFSPSSPPQVCPSAQPQIEPPGCWEEPGRRGCGSRPKWLGSRRRGSGPAGRRRRRPGTGCPLLPPPGRGSGPAAGRGSAPPGRTGPEPGRSAALPGP